MKQAFTIDFEDWYQGIALPLEDWHNKEKRLQVGFDYLMNLLDKHGIKATFFVVGKVFEDHPEMISTIVKEGHEIGCHTYSHPFLFQLTPESFTAEIENCCQLAQQAGIQYQGFRAPYFSIDNRNLWTLDILKRFGFQYDSSIYPGDNKRTGIKGYTKNMHQLPNQLWEVPISTFKMMKYEVGLGGAYFRILPYVYFKRRMKELTRERPAVFYIHPWELDSKHPYLGTLPPRIRYPHYFNLSQTRKRLEMLVQDFEFTTLSNILPKSQNL